MDGLFPVIHQRASFVSSIPKCGACGLDKGCCSPKMPVTGRGERGILVVAESPGAEEDSSNTQLVGAAGQLLRERMWAVGIDLDRDCWKTNALICRPPDNRTPTELEIEFCRPNLKNTIDALKPRQIMPLGLVAAKSLLGPFWKDDSSFGSMGQWVGWEIPFQEWNAWVTPNYHPSYVLRSRDERDGPVVDVWFNRYLAAHARTAGRPWDVVPNYGSEVQIIMDPDRAASWIRDRMQRPGPFSFDFETNCLKPESDGAEIVCCSICWNGRETIAYPWVGEAMAATGEFIASPVPKVGASDLEDRWSRRIFGHGVRNLVWDTTLGAHLLDNRKGIVSVKFQAFIRCGISDWSAAVKPYLRGDGGNGKNRIRELDLRTLLKYCGIDSRVEYEIAVSQRKEFKNAAF